MTPEKDDIYQSFYKTFFNSIFRNVNVTFLCIMNTPTILYAACPVHLGEGGGGVGGQGWEIWPPFSEFSGSAPDQEHITWHHVVFKIILLVYKPLNANSPSYLSDLLTYRRTSHTWRSVSTGDLVEPSLKRELIEIDRLQYVPPDRGTLCLFQYVGVHLLTLKKKKTYHY